MNNKNSDTTKNIGKKAIIKTTVKGTINIFIIAIMIIVIIIIYRILWTWCKIGYGECKMVCVGET